MEQKKAKIELYLNEEGKVETIIEGKGIDLLCIDKNETFKKLVLKSEELLQVFDDKYERSLEIEEVMTSEALRNVLVRRRQVTFTCVGKQVTMSVQELIDYYIDNECVKTAEQCGF